MRTLIPRDDWLQDVIHQDELVAWDPETGPCCTAAAFKLHLSGAARHPWNISASRVFTDHFLATHSDTYNDTWEVRELVLKKTQAHIKTLVRLHRERFVSDDVRRRDAATHRRRERKATVGHFRLLPTTRPHLIYQSSTNAA
jgi:hypothetical protein